MSIFICNIWNGYAFGWVVLAIYQRILCGCFIVDCLFVYLIFVFCNIIFWNRADYNGKVTLERQNTLLEKSQGLVCLLVMLYLGMTGSFAKQDVRKTRVISFSNQSSSVVIRIVSECVNFFLLCSLLYLVTMSSWESRVEICLSRCFPCLNLPLCTGNYFLYDWADQAFMPYKTVVVKTVFSSRKKS